MDYMEFASDLPLHRTTVFRSAEENEEMMQRLGVTQQMRQMGTGKFRADLAVRSTAQAEFYADRFSKSISMYLEPPPGMVGVLFPRSASGRFLASGQDTGNAKVVVIHAGSGIDIVIPDLAGSEALTIPQPRFTAMVEALSPTSDPQASLAVIEGNTAQLRTLRKAVINLLTHPELEPNDEEFSNLLAATIIWITHGTNQSWRSNASPVHAARVRIAKLAQEFIEEHHRETVCIEDLCHVTGVGVRTLQRCYREYFDVSISSYLKTVRLDAARRELTAAYPLEHSVTTIALRNGFTHLGRFSGEFRRRFGESPKDVLAIRAGRKSVCHSGQSVSPRPPAPCRLASCSCICCPRL